MSTGSKDGAFKADAKVIAGVDDKLNQHPINCTEDGTLEVAIGSIAAPLDVIIDNVVTVNQGNPPWSVIIDAGLPIVNNNLISTNASTTPVMLLPNNLNPPTSNRKVVTIYNNSNSALFIKYGSGVSTTFYNFKMPKWSYWESDFYVWSGEFWGVWNTPDGFALAADLF